MQCCLLIDSINVDDMIKTINIKKWQQSDTYVRRKTVDETDGELTVIEKYSKKDIAPR